MTENHEETMVALTALLDLHDAAVKVNAYLKTLIDLPDLDPSVRDELEVAQALIDTQDSVIRHLVEQSQKHTEDLRELAQRADEILKKQ